LLVSSIFLPFFIEQFDSGPGTTNISSQVQASPEPAFLNMRKRVFCSKSPQTSRYIRKADLKGALSALLRSNYAALTAPKQVGALLRSISDYNGHPAAMAALKRSPLLFAHPGELRAAEWLEIDLDAAEWRISASEVKMKVEHLVPLPYQLSFSSCRPNTSR
jgi:integrase